MAEAAGSAVCARLPIAPVSAVCRLVAVAAGVAPMVNWFAPGGESVVACSVMVWLDPSGRVRLNAIESSGIGLVDPRLTEIDGGEPAGPVNGRAGQARIHARELKAERRAILGERHVRTRSANGEAAETVGAEIGLLPLGDQLRQAGLRAVAVEDVVGAGDGGWFNALPEKR